MHLLLEKNPEFATNIFVTKKKAWKMKKYVFYFGQNWWLWSKSVLILLNTDDSECNVWWWESDSTPVFQSSFMPLGDLLCVFFSGLSCPLLLSVSIQGCRNVWKSRGAGINQTPFASTLQQPGRTGGRAGISCYESRLCLQLLLFFPVTEEIL